MGFWFLIIDLGVVNKMEILHIPEADGKFPGTKAKSSNEKVLSE
jgi:hypothetical protein